MKISVIAIVYCLVEAGSVYAHPSPPQTWLNCINIAGSYCPLGQGTYSIIGLQLASGVTISGTGVSPYSTVLQRKDGMTGFMIYIPATATISNLTIDGNRYSFPNEQTGCNTSHGQACGPVGQFGCVHPNLGPHDVHGSATVNQVYFWNSTDVSLYLTAGTLSNSGIYYSRSTGAWVESGTVMLNSFDHNGTAGINLLGSSQKTVKNNVFSQNRYEVSDGEAGGQVYVNYSAANSSVYDNTIDGYSWQTSSANINNCYPPATPQGPGGIEIEPYSSNTKVHSNSVKRNPWYGVEGHSVNSLEVSGYLKDICGSCYPRYIENNTGGPAGLGNGVSFPQPTGFPFSAGLILDRVLSRNNGGSAAYIPQGTTGLGWTGNHCLQGGYSIATTLSQPYPASINTCP